MVNALGPTESQNRAIFGFVGAESGIETSERLDMLGLDLKPVARQTVQVTFLYYKCLVFIALNSTSAPSISRSNLYL